MLRLLPHKPATCHNTHTAHALNCIQCVPLPPQPPQNLEYLEGYGSFLAETGQREEAVAVLQRAVAAQPDEGFEKFM